MHLGVMHSENMWLCVYKVNFLQHCTSQVMPCLFVIQGIDISLTGVQ